MIELRFGTFPLMCVELVDECAEGVTNRANVAMARKRPRAGRVIENRGRS